MNTGLLIAVLTSWLSWTILAAEIPYAAAKNGTFPTCFAQENAKHSPSFSLFITSGLMQITMLLVYFSSNAWHTMLEITGVMVLPAYLTSAIFLVKLSLSKKYPTRAPIKARVALFTGLLGALYSLWLIYAGGLQHLFMVAVLLSLGIPFYIDSGIRHGQEKTFLNRQEVLKITTVALIALLAIFLYFAKKNHL